MRTVRVEKLIEKCSVNNLFFRRCTFYKYKKIGSYIIYNGYSIFWNEYVIISSSESKIAYFMSGEVKMPFNSSSEVKKA